MNCCEECFADDYLRKLIRENGEIGTCSYCGAEDVHTVSPASLYDEFAELLGLYEPVEYGEHYHPDMGKEAIDVGDWLPQVMQEEWGEFFNYSVLSPEKQCTLLDDIRTSNERYDYKNPPTASDEFWTSCDNSFFHVSEDELWYDFCDHIKHHRRFIPAGEGSNRISDPRDWLPLALPAIEKELGRGFMLYRTRLNPSDKRREALPASQMGAPPPRLATSGRASAAGIPVLYTAQEKGTAVSEIRPQREARITIANMQTKKEIVIVDLTAIPFVPSPFGHGDENLSWLIRRSAFLRCIDKALSVPIHKDDADIEYVPTQYVAEVIKESGYDGIQYRSSLRKGGNNIVLFDPNVVDIDPKTELVRITATSIEFETVE